VPRKGRSSKEKRAPKRRVLRVVERAVLGAIMSAVAFVVERQLLRALKKGGRKPEPARQGQLFTATQQVRDETRS
jgi:hypothetical protein